MHKAVAYEALARELERWRSMTSRELVENVCKPPFVKHTNVNGEDIEIEIALQWRDAGRTTICIVGVANGPSHWRLERLEESVVVSVS